MKANVLPKQDTHNIYRITWPKIAKVALCEAGVLKERGIEAWRENTILKGTNKKNQRATHKRNRITKRKQRTAYVEPAFAQLKHNHDFRRFSLKGMQKNRIRVRFNGFSTQLKKENCRLKAILNPFKNQK